MDPDEVGKLIDDCVRCGFCLPTCPTYVLWGEEMDSPRGRINLMKQHQEGEPIGPAMAGHFDACLGCMACVTACPSGVQYDKLIEHTRAEVEEQHPRTLRWSWSCSRPKDAQAARLPTNCSAGSAR